MPNLVQSFQGHDVGFLRIVAHLWGIELAASDIEKATDELSKALLDQSMFIEMVDTLPDVARNALGALAKADGKLPWATFTRQFGEIRDAGPGRRDREQIYLNPVSASEILFYRALLAKAFFDMPAGAQEFAYIPSEFLKLFIHEISLPINYSQGMEEPENLGLNPPTTEAYSGFSGPLGRPATPKERARILASSDRILDDATTILAAMRMGLPLPKTRIPGRVILDFLSASKIIPPVSIKEKTQAGKPLIDAIRRFLEASRNKALEIFLTDWLESESFNELHQVPGIIYEGDWINQPLVARKYLLSSLKLIPDNKWWSLPVFVLSIKEKNPDFQRPAGDYDSWFIKRESDGTYLRGFENWDGVDGALIRYMITGPMFWLGLVELATPADNDVVSAFRIKKRTFRELVSETGKLYVSSQGKIIVPRLLSRLTRYQIARFCDWDEEKENEYVYWVTTASLEKAANQGLKVSQLLGLLARNSVAEIPPSFVKALMRWEHYGTEARLEIHTILKVSQPEILEELRKSKASRFLGETLSPVTVTVKSGAEQKVLAALVEHGLLGEDVHEE